MRSLIGILTQHQSLIEPVILHTTHLFPLQIGHFTCALCGAGKVTVIALFMLTPLFYQFFLVVYLLNQHDLISLEK